MKKLRKIVAALLLLTVAVPLAGAAKEGTARVIVMSEYDVGTDESAGDEIELNLSSITENGRTLVPIREVAEAMGATVTWDAATKTVLLERTVPVYESYGTTTAAVAGSYYAVLLTIGNSTMQYTDGEEASAQATLEVAPRIVNGRTMLPLRAACEYLNAKVDWSGNGTITIFPVTAEYQSIWYEGGYTTGNINKFLYGSVTSPSETISYSKYGFSMEIPKNWYDSYFENKNGFGYFIPDNYAINSSLMVTIHTRETADMSSEYLEHYVSSLAESTQTFTLLEQEMRTTKSGIAYAYVRFSGGTQPTSGYERALFAGNEGVMMLQLMTNLSELGKTDVFSTIANSVTI